MFLPGLEKLGDGNKNQGSQVSCQPVGLTEGGKDTAFDVLDPNVGVKTQALGQAVE